MESRGGLEGYGKPPFFLDCLVVIQGVTDHPFYYVQWQVVMICPSVSCFSIDIEVCIFNVIFSVSLIGAQEKTWRS